MSLVASLKLGSYVRVLNRLNSLPQEAVKFAVVVVFLVNIKSSNVYLIRQSS